MIRELVHAGELDFPEAFEDGVALPSFGHFVRESAIVPAAYLRMKQRAGAAVSDGNRSFPRLEPSGSPTYQHEVAGLTGVLLDASGDAFSSDVLDPGVISTMFSWIFSTAGLGVVRYIGGRQSAVGASNALLALIFSDDNVYCYADDGTMNRQPVAALGPLVAGEIYQFSMVLDRANNFVRGRLAQRGVGLIDAEVSISTAGMATISGGITPRTELGSTVSGRNAAGITELGFIAAQGAQVEGAGKLLATHQATGFE